MQSRTCTDSAGSTWMVTTCFCQLTASSTVLLAVEAVAGASAAAAAVSSVCGEVDLDDAGLVSLHPAVSSLQMFRQRAAHHVQVGRPKWATAALPRPPPRCC